VPRHCARRATRLAEGGFQISLHMTTDNRTEGIRVTPGAAGWRVAGSSALDGARLVRARRAGGLVLLAADGTRELARATPVPGPSDASRLRHVLLDDGRVFCFGPLPGRADWSVTGWETAGAYLTVSPLAEGGVGLEPTPAAGGLEDLDVLCLIAAAEALDALGQLEPGNDDRAA
jgi:hypothetical protein